MLVPLPPRSTSAMTPAGKPGAVCSAVSAARESGISAAGTPPGDRFGLSRRAPRNAPTVAGPQCAGTAMATGWPPPTVFASASRASTSTRSPRWELPSSATSGTGSPTRSTKPVSTTPGWLSAGFSRGDTDLGGAVGEQRQHGAAHHGRPADARGDQVGRPDGQPQRMLLMRGLLYLGRPSR